MTAIASISAKGAPIPATVAGLREAFGTGKTRSYQWRMQQLGRLRDLLEERQQELLAALEADLGKSRFEGWMAEIALTLEELAYTRKHLAAWMKPEKVSTPLAMQPGSCRVQRDPLGVVLIIAPWNYPVQLALCPLIGAIAAGNCAIVKPSEVAEHTSRALAELVPQYLDTDCVRVVEGGVPETTALLAERFDHIFYTGNGRVGRIVMKAAAEHLTPVTLELGGKSPTIVDRSANLEVTARRIVWGKFFNAGQTCVAPDYVLVDRSVEADLIAALGDTIRGFFGDDPRRSDDYGRIINGRHHERLVGLLEGCDVTLGGDHDADERYLAPTLVRDPEPDAPVMADEIFGPILPIIGVDSVTDAIRFVNERPKPLALYVFTEKPHVAARVLEETSSGGACVNDAVMHLGVHELPFGGVGESGMGAYHGRASFETFSHRKSVLDKSSRLDLKLRYPPYDDNKAKWLRRLM